MTSRPLHVRLEIAVDANPALCSRRCKLFVPGRCGVFGRLASLGGYDNDWLRHKACHDATVAHALNAAVVEAAKRLVAAYSTGILDDEYDCLTGAIDALLSAEKKETKR